MRITMDRKEAIEILKKNYPHVSSSGTQFESALRELIPELKESEDERIRRIMIDHFKNQPEQYTFGGLTNDEVVAYLEKQKEQKPIRSVAQLPGNNDVFDANLNEIKNIDEAAGYYMQGEIDTDSDCLDEDGQPLYYADALRKAFLFGAKWQKEQKPVEIHIDNPNIQKYDDVKISTSDSSASGDELLYVCNKSYNIGFRDGVASVKPAEHPEKGNEYWFGFNEGKGTVLDNPEQFGLYKPAEWSEEDRKMLDAIIKRYSFPIETDFSVFVGEDNLKDMREELGWLKSLRPQPHWKPSEEQMTALNEMIDYCAQHKSSHWNDMLFNILRRLRNQLKSL